MEIITTLEWDAIFLRRMVTWCCKQIGMPVRTIRTAAFRKSSSAWGGRAYYRGNRIGVRVGDASWFPAGCDNHGKGERFLDRLECLVAVTAHEAYHLAAFYVPSHKQATRAKRRGSSERRTCLEEIRVLHLFRANRDSLLAEWSAGKESTADKPTSSVIEKRAAKVDAKLDEWTRKAKMAAKKVKKYCQKAAYYEKKLALIASAPTAVLKQQKPRVRTKPTIAELTAERVDSIDGYNGGETIYFKEGWVHDGCTLWNVHSRKERSNAIRDAVRGEPE